MPNNPNVLSPGPPPPNAPRRRQGGRGNNGGGQRFQRNNQPIPLNAGVHNPNARINNGNAAGAPTPPNVNVAPQAVSSADRSMGFGEFQKNILEPAKQKLANNDSLLGEPRSTITKLVSPQDVTRLRQADPSLTQDAAVDKASMDVQDDIIDNILLKKNEDGELDSNGPNFGKLRVLAKTLDKPSYEAIFARLAKRIRDGEFAKGAKPDKEISDKWLRFVQGGDHVVAFDVANIKHTEINTGAEKVQKPNYGDIAKNLPGAIFKFGKHSVENIAAGIKNVVEHPAILKQALKQMRDNYDIRKWGDKSLTWKTFAVIGLVESAYVTWMSPFPEAQRIKGALNFAVINGARVGMAMHHTGQEGKIGKKYQESVTNNDQKVTRTDFEQKVFRLRTHHSAANKFLSEAASGLSLASGLNMLDQGIHIGSAVNIAGPHLLEHAAPAMAKPLHHLLPGLPMQDKFLDVGSIGGVPGEASAQAVGNLAEASPTVPPVLPAEGFIGPPAPEVPEAPQIPTGYHLAALHPGGGATLETGVYHPGSARESLHMIAGRPAVDANPTLAVLHNGDTIPVTQPDGSSVDTVWHPASEGTTQIQVTGIHVDQATGNIVDNNGGLHKPDDISPVHPNGKDVTWGELNSLNGVHIDSGTGDIVDGNGGMHKPSDLSPVNAGGKNLTWGELQAQTTGDVNFRLPGLDDVVKAGQGGLKTVDTWANEPHDPVKLVQDTVSAAVHKTQEAANFVNDKSGGQIGNVLNAVREPIENALDEKNLKPLGDALGHAKDAVGQQIGQGIGEGQKFINQQIDSLQGQGHTASLDQQVAVSPTAEGVVGPKVPDTTAHAEPVGLKATIPVTDHAASSATEPIQGSLDNDVTQHDPEEVSPYPSASKGRNLTWGEIQARPAMGADATESQLRTANLSGDMVSKPGVRTASLAIPPPDGVTEAIKVTVDTHPEITKKVVDAVTSSQPTILANVQGYADQAFETNKEFIKQAITSEYAASGNPLSDTQLDAMSETIHQKLQQVAREQFSGGVRHAIDTLSQSTNPVDQKLMTIVSSKNASELSDMFTKLAAVDAENQTITAALNKPGLGMLERGTLMTQQLKLAGKLGQLGLTPDEAVRLGTLQQDAQNYFTTNYAGRVDTMYIDQLARAEASKLLGTPSLHPTPTLSPSVAPAPVVVPSIATAPVAPTLPPAIPVESLGAPPEVVSAQRLARAGAAIAQAVVTDPDVQTFLHTSLESQADAVQQLLANSGYPPIQITPEMVENARQAFEPYAGEALNRSIAQSLQELVHTANDPTFVAEVTNLSQNNPEQLAAIVGRAMTDPTFLTSAEGAKYAPFIANVQSHYNQLLTDAMNDATFKGNVLSFGDQAINDAEKAVDLYIRQGQPVPIDIARTVQAVDSVLNNMQTPPALRRLVQTVATNPDLQQELADAMGRPAGVSIDTYGGFAKTFLQQYGLNAPDLTPTGIHSAITDLQAELAPYGDADVDKTLADLSKMIDEDTIKELRQIELSKLLAIAQNDLSHNPPLDATDTDEQLVRNLLTKVENLNYSMSQNPAIRAKVAARSDEWLEWARQLNHDTLGQPVGGAVASVPVDQTPTLVPADRAADSLAHQVKPLTAPAITPVSPSPVPVVPVEPAAGVSAPLESTVPKPDLEVVKPLPPTGPPPPPVQAPRGLPLPEELANGVKPEDFDKYFTTVPIHPGDTVGGLLNNAGELVWGSKGAEVFGVHLVANYPLFEQMWERAGVAPEFRIKLDELPALVAAAKDADPAISTPALKRMYESMRLIPTPGDFHILKSDAAAVLLQGNGGPSVEDLQHMIAMQADTHAAVVGGAPQAAVESVMPTVDHDTTPAPVADPDARAKLNAVLGDKGAIMSSSGKGMIPTESVTTAPVVIPAVEAVAPPQIDTVLPSTPSAQVVEPVNVEPELVAAPVDVAPTPSVPVVTTEPVGLNATVATGDTVDTSANPGPAVVQAKFVPSQQLTSQWRNDAGLLATDQASQQGLPVDGSLPTGVTQPTMVQASLVTPPTAAGDMVEAAVKVPLASVDAVSDQFGEALQKDIVFEPNIHKLAMDRLSSAQQVIDKAFLDQEGMDTTDSQYGPAMTQVMLALDDMAKEQYQTSLHNAIAHLAQGSGEDKALFNILSKKTPEDFHDMLEGLREADAHYTGGDKLWADAKLHSLGLTASQGTRIGQLLDETNQQSAVLYAQATTNDVITEKAEYFAKAVNHVGEVAPDAVDNTTAHFTEAFQTDVAVGATIDKISDDRFSQARGAIDQALNDQQIKLTDKEYSTAIIKIIHQIDDMTKEEYQQSLHFAMGQLKDGKYPGDTSLFQTLSQKTPDEIHTMLEVLKEHDNTKLPAIGLSVHQATRIDMLLDQTNQGAELSLYTDKAQGYSKIIEKTQHIIANIKSPVASPAPVIPGEPPVGEAPDVAPEAVDAVVSFDTKRAEDISEKVSETLKKTVDIKPGDTVGGFLQNEGELAWGPDGVRPFAAHFVENYGLFQKMWDASGTPAEYRISLAELPQVIADAEGTDPVVSKKALERLYESMRLIPTPEKFTVLKPQGVSTIIDELGITPKTAEVPQAA